MKGAERVQWFRFVDNLGGEWTVWICTYVWMARFARVIGHAHLHGLSEFKQREIFIDASDDRREQDETMLHELMHAVEPDKWHHERLVAGLSPKLYPALHRLGFRWPRRPRGAARIERLARRQAEESDA